jgi:hypothetical protein
MLLPPSLFNLGVIRLGTWKVKGNDGGRLDLPERLRINRKYGVPLSMSRFPERRSQEALRGPNTKLSAMVKLTGQP